MIRRGLLLAAAAWLLSSCAAWTVVPADTRVAFDSGLSVLPKHTWAASTDYGEPNMRLWTQDGTTLNGLAFVRGVAHGAPIVKGACT